jgi:hypothetical protein
MMMMRDEGSDPHRPPWATKSHRVPTPAQSPRAACADVSPPVGPVLT